MSQVAIRYAQSLFEIAKEQNNLETVYESLMEIGQMIHRSAELHAFLFNPLLSFEERSKVFTAMFGGKIPDSLLKFLRFVAFKNRLSQLPSIIEEFDRSFLKYKNQMRVTIETALPLPPQDQQTIKEHLSQKFHKDILPEWKMNPWLIGGFRIMAQGQLFDYSFRNQLNHFYQDSSK